MKLLTTCGYADQLGGNYQWTDKIAPFMRRWHIWTEADTSHSDIAQARHIAQSDALASTMPDRVKQKVRAELAAGSVLRAISVMKKHWDGERWLEVAKPTGSDGKLVSELDMGTAKTLVQKLGQRN